MPRCPRCDHVQSTPFDRCPVCDLPQSATADDRTVPSGSGSSGGSSSATVRSGLAASRPRDGERFAPGQLLLERYRVLGRIGAGAMGEVYRAEDLTLDQPVALKFLPEAFGRAPHRRQRFLQEVKLARQVAHPNVCRVYDVGEVDGQLFLSMEYVDGRDLASTLRSIGRFPQEKALEIARQLCAGLAALHDRHVLHRDLKPANVMLDDAGRVRITDFGLAGAADQVTGADVRSGTPLYMAPEQLEGQEVTERSDIYALGLVLYEVFTGQRAYTADTVEQLTSLRRSSAPSRLSSHVAEVDPAVERVVARCLDPDPARRPPSALVVATALPGGDPLAAALAMGETPSAALVAAAGGKGGIRPVLGLLMLAIALAGLVAGTEVAGNAKLVQRFDLRRSADALEERARQLVVAAGYDERHTDSARSFARGDDILAWLAEQDSSAGRWDRLAEARPLPILFWYRQAPDYLLASDKDSPVTRTDPPPLVAGMIEVVLDAYGRLVTFTAVPPESLTVTAAADTVADVTWERFFAAAELDPAAFAPSAPGWIPDVYASRRRAWSGTLACAGHDAPVVIEAGEIGGRPVYFRLHGPWTRDVRTDPEPTRTSGAEIAIVVVVLGVLTAGVSLAVRHHRRGRTDTVGAGRVAVVLLGMPVVRWVFVLHHAPLPQSLLNSFFQAVAVGALYALLCLLLYLALEPLVRRIWPQTMIGWTRLVGGGWRDPMVGRSVLVGGAMFGLTSLFFAGATVVMRALGVPPSAGGQFDLYLLAVPRALVGNLAIEVPNSFFNALFFLMLLVLMRLLVRRRWPAYLLFLLVAAGIIAGGAGDWRVALVFGPALAAIWLVIMVRGGVLAFAVGFFLWRIADGFPLTFDFTQMYAATSLALMAAIVVVLAAALGIALGGRSLLADDVGGR